MRGLLLCSIYWRTVASLGATGDVLDGHTVHAVPLVGGGGEALCVQEEEQGGNKGRDGELLQLQPCPGLVDT